MSLKATLIRLWYRPKVVHRLPGRLRIHIPLLQKITKDQQHVLPLVASLVTVPEGIDNAEACAVSGNLLIGYDLTRVSEAEVLGYFRSLSDILVRYIEPLSQVSCERAPAIVERLRGVLRGALDGDMTLDPGLELPGDVLA